MAPRPKQGLLRISKVDEQDKLDALLAKMTAMGLDQKEHNADVTKTLGDVSINMATVNANIQNIKEKTAEDRKELRESIASAHKRVDKINGEVQANSESIKNQNHRIHDIDTKLDSNENRIVRIESNVGLEAPKKNKTKPNYQMWAIIIGAVVTLGTAVIGAYVSINTDKPTVTAPENP